MTKANLSAAAGKQTGKSAANQADSTAPVAEKKSKSPDNNKRLAYLEDRFARLGLGLQGFTIDPNADPVDTTVSLLSELRQRQLAQQTIDDDRAGLSSFLTARADLQPVAGEGPGASAVRVIGALDARIAEGEQLAGVLKVEKEAAERDAAAHKEDRDGMAVQLDQLSAFFGDRAGFERAEGEALPDAIASYVTRLTDTGEGAVGRVIGLQAALDAATAQNSDDAAQIARLTTRVDEQSEALKKRARGDAQRELDRQKGPPEPHPLTVPEVATFSELPAGLPLTLRFTDGEGLLDQPARAVERGEIELHGQRGLLMATIDLSPIGPASRATTAWLIAGDGSMPDSEARACRCEISGGVRFGGGTTAQLPKGHLIF